MSKLKRIPLWMPFLLTVSCCLLAFLGTGYYLRSVPWGMFGGDCVESSGIVTISGVVMDINNQPIEGAQIRVIKADGGCPQSASFHQTTTSDVGGDFITFIYFTVADPEAQIEISVDGYTPCRFNFYPPNARESFTLQLTITLDATMQVEGNVTNNAGSVTRDIETCS